MGWPRTELRRQLVDAVLRGEKTATAGLAEDDDDPEAGPGDRTVLLETNQLSTFVGQSVQYAFRRGAEESLEAVTLDLLPVSITGDLVTIQADVSGALPGSDGASLLSRHERIVASRRATSALAATSGTPPAGYRFQVTPDF